MSRAGGEAQYLSRAERLAVAEVVLASAEDMPVIVGCTAASIEEAVELAAHASEHGASCVMVGPPAAELPRAQLMRYFGEVAGRRSACACDGSGRPPVSRGLCRPRRGQDLREVWANVRYAKPEGLPAADQIAEFRAAGVGVFGGNGGLYFLDVLEAGGTGMIPGCELAGTFHRIFTAYRRGRAGEARALYTRALPLLVAEFTSLEYLVAAQKTLLVERGVISSARTRAAASLSSLGRRLLLAHARAAGAFE